MNKIITDNMRWMHTNPVIQYSLTVLGSCGALIYFFFLFVFTFSSISVQMY